MKQGASRDEKVSCEARVDGQDQNGKKGGIPRLFSYEWQTKDLEDTELGRVYGKLEKCGKQKADPSPRKNRGDSG